MQLCQPWVRKLLLGAGSLTVLSTPLHMIPRSPTFQHLRLRHLEVAASSGAFYWLDRFFKDVSCSHTLESLRIICNTADEPPQIMSMHLPSMRLLSMPSLKRIRLDNCLPGHELALPAECALFIDDLGVDGHMWQLQREKLRHHTTVLQMYLSDLGQWPHGLDSFTNLQYLGLDIDSAWVLDLADLQHIPHVRMTLASIEDLQLTAGSWQTLEIFRHLDELHIDITDVDSFVRDTRDFTFMSGSPHGVSTW